MNRRRTGRANRIALTVVGVLLTAAGGTALARASGLGSGVLGGGHDPVLDAATRRFAAGHGWFWPALAAFAALIALLALAWLVAQIRPRTARRLSLEYGGHGATWLRARAAARTIEDDLTGGSHIEHCRARFTGDPARPELAIVITLRADGDPAKARDRIRQAVTRFRDALETDQLTATVRIR
jgi:hypothetical protein